MLSEIEKIRELPVIAIVGASGFVGKNLVRMLATRNDVLVRTLSRGATDVSEQHPNITAIQGDLTKPETLENFLVPGCIVVNLAYGFNMSSEENLQAAKNLATICKDSKISRLIHCSTASVFGRNHQDVVTEESVCRPQTEYGLTKLKIEQILYEASRSYYEFVNLRPTSVFGPNGRALIKLITSLMHGSMVLNYLRSCVFNTRKLNLVSVDTVSAAILFIAEIKSDVDGQTFIISEDDEKINNFQYVERYLIERLVGSYYKISPLNIPLFFLSWVLRARGRDACNPCRVYDSSKIQKIGFRPSMPLQHSLVKFIAWYKTQYATEQREGM